MATSKKIELNFLPLTHSDFDVTLYCLPYIENKRPSIGGELAVQRWLNIDATREVYWTLSQPTEGAECLTVRSRENIFAATNSLQEALIRSCQMRLKPDEYDISEKIKRRIEIHIQRFPEGVQIVTVEPYFLYIAKQFGFLLDFHFRPLPAYRRTIRALQLSLSLNKNGKSNLDYYADRRMVLMDFMKRFIPRIFPITVSNDQRLRVERSLSIVDSASLDVKNYVVHADHESRSQFMGVKRYGPLRDVQSARLYFIHRESDRTLSRDLFRALKGNVFRTFDGMDQMFQFPISKKNVRGMTIRDFTSPEIRRVRDNIIADTDDGSSIVPVILTPFGKLDPAEKNEAYWLLKHSFLSKNLPIQVVDTRTVSDKETLKWSTASIGLQIFAKAGGIPWKVRPQTARRLIVGIGQAHHRSEERIDRYFAYSVLTESSGMFREVRFLGKGQEESHYIEEFTENLRKIISDYSGDFSSFVIHSTFSIRRKEMEAIAEVLKNRKDQQEDDGEFVSIKFNDRNGFFGFAKEHNSYVPFESTTVRLSSHSFLVWFEGRQYGKPTVHKGIAAPIHINFQFPFGELTDSQKRTHLQDAINLSGANWRGFNAKNLPVSVYYAQLIARYLKEFDQLELPAINVDILKPWFL